MFICGYAGKLRWLGPETVMSWDQRRISLNEDRRMTPIANIQTERIAYSSRGSTMMAANNDNDGHSNNVIRERKVGVNGPRVL